MPLSKYVRSTGLAGAAAPLLSACEGPQSALDPAGSAAALIARLWWPTLFVAALVTLLVLTLLAVAVLRARRKQAALPLNARQSRNLVIAGGILLPLAATIPFALSSFSIGRVIEAPVPDVAMTVEVIGKQWWWEVHYLDETGERIATTANEIHVPVGEPVRFLLKSDNVIHSFWVPNLKGKTDMMPGRSNVTAMTADEPGVYRGQCAEYCGTQHALMAFLLVAEAPEAFDAWLEGQRRSAMEPETGAQAQGRDVFLDAGCAGCHTIRGTPADGDLGPDLTHLAGRRTLAGATVPNRIGHLGGWITDPQHVKPGSRMPPSDLTPEELKTLLDYLESLE
ncbi:cytochrome c oxidase subunit II [Halomonas sp. MCCC 1A17488]|uniref:cytochrome c oxidase subunit II n=1 Tax=unclassified Halomonas TaxID=2609666 RepID=UPI0018D21F9E|nr:MULTISPECIES: cytochrome c oxidase subunit II [unclassified Halomonas]MCE8016373.1 cytochrome c oxidase subunit II [Halomonas sp. MCCC 1A17488]MCG3239706.1 cytochrome c oxidase subunit II [Halomonas sp. MCCC 1A17488]QPP50385.1 cytochrome c oxidase subunit II [Halomonas sp. SS10-MC5]